MPIFAVYCRTNQSEVSFDFPLTLALVVLVVTGDLDLQIPRLSQTEKQELPVVEKNMM